MKPKHLVLSLLIISAGGILGGMAMHAEAVNSEFPLEFPEFEIPTPNPPIVPQPENQTIIDKIMDLD